MGNYSVEISGFDSDAVGFSSTASSTSVGVGESKIVSFDGTYLRTAGVSGQVSVEGEGLNGVMVSLRGGPDNVDESTTTDAAGQYAFASLRAGTYTVGISGWDDTDFEFEVTSKSVTVALGETGYVEFEGELLRTSGLAGRVSVGGMGMAGVTVTLSGTADATANTDASGIYAFAGLAAGDYTVTISGYDAVEYSFDDSQTVTLEMDKTAIVNFDGMALRTASVKVMVTADGEGVAGVTATLTLVTGATSGTILSGAPTGADGSHTFGPLLAGNYRVDISGFDDEIDFADGTNWQGPVATGGMAEANFAGMINRTGSIAGMVTADGEGMGGVTVTLGGAGDASMMTADDGSYSFTGLRRGDYTVSIANPDDAMYSFPTTSRAVSVAIGQMHSDVSFAGTMIRRGSISGQVSVEGMGLDSVTVTLSGAHDATAMTDASGQYAFSGLGGGAYTVSMTNPSAAAYTFEHTSADVMIGNAESRVQNFTGMHTRTASISGMLYVDEAEKNDMYDDGEDMLAAANVELALIGPSIAERRTGTTGEDGSFSFGELRKGSYQLQVAASAMIPADYGYGGPATGYDVMVAPGEAATQNVPFDITHTTVSFSVMLKSGDETGDALPGAMVMLYADDDGEDMVGEAKTDEMGMASIRFAREGTSGNMVYAMVASGDYRVDPDAGMQTVMFDPKSTMADASNAANITNMNVDVTVSGATITTEYGGGDALKGWAIGVTMGTGDDAEAYEGDHVPEMLDDDGMASFETTVESVPATFTFAVADDQDNKMDGGEKYEGSDVEYVHTGLSLMGTMDAGMLEVTYTTQTLMVYVHHEKDQVWGYTGSILGGDVRDEAHNIEVGIRYIDNSGRSRPFPSSVEYKYTKSKGVHTFRNVPADAKVIVTADDNDADGVMLLDPDELATYRDMEENGVTDGAFGDMGGFSPSVKLCPLMSVDPTDQDHGECGSFAFVSTHSVIGQVWKRQVVRGTKDANDDSFKTNDPVFQKGISVALDPVDGKNLAGDAETATTLSAAVRSPGEGAARTAWDDVLDERSQFDFGNIAAGVYTLSVSDGWRATEGEKGSEDALGDALNLNDNLEIDVTPATATVYGYVRDSQEFPVEGAAVSVGGVPATTDRHGRYIAEGIAAKKVNVTTAETGSNPTKHALTLAANTLTQHDITLTGVGKTAAVSGTVTASGSGDPIAGAEIKVDGEAPLNKATKGTNAGKLVTGADGTYRAIFPAEALGETATVTVTKVGMSFVPAALNTPAHDGADISGINFSGFPHATISGRIKDPEGNAMGGVTVTATNTGSDEEFAMVTSTGNAKGTYSLSVPFGTYRIAAEATGYSFWYTNNNQTVSVAPGQSFTFGDIQATKLPDPKSDDATLSALSLGDVTLSPAFASGTMAYTANAAHDDESVTVTATANDAEATFKITPEDADGDDTNGHQVPLTAGGDTEITVDVTAEDGTTTGKYTVTVSRAAAPPAEDDATLKSLTVSDGSLDPVFASATIEYAVEVAHDVEEITVTAVATNSGASLAYKPAADANFGKDGYQVALKPGPNPVEITVTPADATADKMVYTINVTRAMADATLSALIFMSYNAADEAVTRALTPVFEAGKAAEKDGYKVKIAHDDGDMVTVMATASDEAAKVTYVPAADQDGNKPGHQVNISDQPITVTVMGADETTTDSYVINVTRADAPDPTVATLSALSLGAVDLNEDFDEDEVAYTADVDADVSSVTVTAAASAEKATIKIKVGSADAVDFNADGHNVELEDAGDATTITLTVTAEDDETKKTYTIKVSRAMQVPSAPRNLKVVSSRESGQLTFSWEAPASEGGPPAITDYQYRIDSGDWATVTGGATAREATAENLQDGDLVTIMVRAVKETDGSSDGFEVIGDEASAMGTSWPDFGSPAVAVDPTTTSEGGEDNAVEVTVALSGPATSATTVELVLTEQVEGESVDAAKRFTSVPSVTIGAGRTSATVTLDPADNQMDDDGNPVVTINAKVTNAEAADRAASTGGPTVTIEDDDYKPAPVQNVAATAGNGQVTLTWDDLGEFVDSNAVGKGNRGNFKYQYRFRLSSSTDDWTGGWKDASHSNDGLVIENLNNGSGYTFQVRGVSDAGEGDPGEITGTPTGS